MANPIAPVAPLLSPLKRKREDEHTPEPSPSNHEDKRRRLRSVPTRIIVLIGEFGDSDDQSPIVKYWDPDFCSDVILSNRILEKLKKPIENRGFVCYLLSGNNPDEESIDEDFLEHTPTELGVREFKKSVCVDLDF